MNEAATRLELLPKDKCQVWPANHLRTAILLPSIIWMLGKIYLN